MINRKDNLLIVLFFVAAILLKIFSLALFMQLQFKKDMFIQMMLNQ